MGIVIDMAASPAQRKSKARTFGVWFNGMALAIIIIVIVIALVIK